VPLQYTIVTTKTVTAQTLSARQEYESAKSKREQLQTMRDENKRTLEDLQVRRHQLSKQLVLGVLKFQTKGLSRNYRKVVRGQIDMLKHHMDLLQGQLGSWIAVEQLREVQAHLEAVLESFDAAQQEAFKDQAFSRKWACSILGVAERDILAVTESDYVATVKRAYRQKAIHFHPDKDAGEKEMFQNLRRAAEILGYSA